MIDLPNHHFGFREAQAAVGQVHRVTMVIEKAFEEKKHCPVVYVDVSQAFDRVWHLGMLHKISSKLTAKI